jgi:FkbM family methyltransferase
MFSRWRSLRQYLIYQLVLSRPRFRLWLSKLIAGDRELEVRFIGDTFRVHSVAEFGLVRASRLAESSSLLRDELPVLLNLANLFRDGDVFVDVGANVGLYSKLLSRLQSFHPRLRVVAFEPHPLTFQRLKENLRTTSAEVHCIALSGSTKRLQFFEGSASAVFSAEKSPFSLRNRPVWIQTKRLDEISLPDGPLVLKIDVEGHEFEILRGAAGLFAQRRIAVVFLDGFGESSIPRFLTDFGFVLFDAPTLRPFGEGHRQLLAVQPERVEK